MTHDDNSDTSGNRIDALTDFTLCWIDRRVQQERAAARQEQEASSDNANQQ